MKLHIEKREASEGFLFKKKIYEMYVKIEMTPEERVAYERVKDEIKDMIIVEYEYKGLELNFTIGRLVYNHDKNKDTGSRFVFSAQHEIPPMEKDIKDGVSGFSKHLKSVVAGGNLGQETTEL